MSAGLKLTRRLVLDNGHYATTQAQIPTCRSAIILIVGLLSLQWWLNTGGGQTGFLGGPEIPGRTALSWPVSRSQRPNPVSLAPRHGEALVGFLSPESGTWQFTRGFAAPSFVFFEKIILRRKALTLWLFAVTFP